MSSKKTMSYCNVKFGCSFIKKNRFLYSLCILARINRGCYFPREKVNMNVNIDNQSMWGFKLKVYLHQYIKYRLGGSYLESYIFREKSGKCLIHFDVL